MRWKANIKELLPGEHLKYTLNISRLFDLTSAETYSVEVAMQINENIRGKDMTLEVKGVTFIVKEPSEVR